LVISGIEYSTPDCPWQTSDSPDIVPAGSGDGVQSSKDIVVYSTPEPAGIISGLSPVCQGQADVPYSVPEITNAETYIWEYSGDGSTIEGTTNSVLISFSNTATAGDLTVKGYNEGCGEGEESSKLINVDFLPNPANPISGLSEVCQGQSNVQYSIPIIQYANSYIWEYSGNGVTLDIASNVVLISFSETATSGILSVKGQNDCGNGPESIKTITLETLPGPSENIIGFDIVCQGQSNVIYNVPIIQHASTYVWEYTGEGIILDGTTNFITISFLNTATSGILRVKGQNSCGYGPQSSKSITVEPLPTESGTILGLDSVCPKQTNIQYSIPEIQFADNYIWEYSGNGASINMDNNHILISFSRSATSGTLSVSGQNDCGSGGSSYKSIYINPLPDSVSIVPKPNPEFHNYPVYLLIYPGDTTGIIHNYQWYFEEDLLENDTLKYYYREGGILEGTYRLRVENEFKCAIELEYEYIKDKSGLFEKSDVFVIYPNPNYGEFNLTLNDEIIPEDAVSIDCRIFDIHGKVVYQTELPRQDQYIRLNELNKGIYFFELNAIGIDKQILKLIIL